MEAPILGDPNEEGSVPRRQIPSFQIRQKGSFKNGQWPWITNFQPHKLRGAKLLPRPPLNKPHLPHPSSKGSAKRVPLVLRSGTAPLLLPTYPLRLRVGRPLHQIIRPLGETILEPTCHNWLAGSGFFLRLYCRVGVHLPTGG